MGGRNRKDLSDLLCGVQRAVTRVFTSSSRQAGEEVLSAVHRLAGGGGVQAPVTGLQAQIPSLSAPVRWLPGKLLRDRGPWDQGV